MNVTVEYYGVLRSLCGQREQVFDVAPGTTAAALIDRVCAEHSALGSALRGVAVAIDERLVSRDTPLTAPCVVALLPPVSGG